ncbi:MAG: FAD-binding protein [Ruminococcaceae bacterium]|nr:FAD-binding protein [Oscillospiraceae bacterium]
MNGESLLIHGSVVETHHCSVLVIGSGAAGLAAALRLWQAGVHDVVLMSEDRCAGTSRNTGSDKQTYYKLTLSGDVPDSVGHMAETLFNGGGMDGELARIEAALSAACFQWLCDLGVPFPRNRYGEAVGYKTDHDPLSRASSAGPLTSRMMVESLEKALAETAVALLDQRQAVTLLTEPLEHRVLGALALDLPGNRTSRCSLPRYTLVLASFIVLAVGGPAMVYSDRVYPGSQLGGTGLALSAGALAVNLTEWQYGLASLMPRWNVSGSYQQVLPRYISTDETGSDTRDFLAEWIPDRRRRLSLVFRKGYQWPFDSRKLDGSSLIDLLVYRETVLLNRRVFLDFRSNDIGQAVTPQDMDEETAQYLIRSGATAELPWQRLRQMNDPAYAFYLSHGVDLANEPLEIHLCAQHHNGGLAVDTNWQSQVNGLYAVGEVSGTHGVYRPGGSALNSGQVGAWRAAEHIRHCLQNPSDSQVASRRPCQPATHSASVMKQLHDLLLPANPNVTEEPGQLERKWLAAAQQMSRFAGPFRDIGRLPELLRAIEQDLEEYGQNLPAKSSDEAALAWRLRDLLLTQRFLVLAMLDYVNHGGTSRGSALYLEDGGILPLPGLPDYFRFRHDGLPLTDQIQSLQLTHAGQITGQIAIQWKPVRPVPHPDESFEQVWRAWRGQNANSAESR